MPFKFAKSAGHQILSFKHTYCAAVIQNQFMCVLHCEPQTIETIYPFLIELN